MWQPPGLRALNEVLWELPPSDLQVLFYHRMLRCWRILARKHTRRCLIDERIAVEDLKEVARYWAAQRRHEAEQAYERRHPGLPG